MSRTAAVGVEVVAEKALAAVVVALVAVVVVVVDVVGNSPAAAVAVALDHNIGSSNLIEEWHYSGRCLRKGVVENHEWGNPIVGSFRACLAWAYCNPVASYHHRHRAHWDWIPSALVDREALVALTAADSTASSSCRQSGLADIASDGAGGMASAALNCGSEA